MREDDVRHHDHQVQENGRVQDLAIVRVVSLVRPRRSREHSRPWRGQPAPLALPTSSALLDLEPSRS